jgi:preprotein translocase subunit SecE
MNTFFAQSWQFIKEAYAELKKVTWLSKKEVIASTVVVIILVIVIAIFVGSVDFVLARILAILL